MTNKEAIKILQNDGCCQDCTFGGYPCKLIGCETHQAIDLAIKALEETQQGKWIPVSERLPDDREDTYWICTDGEYQCQCRWTNDNAFWSGLKTDWHWCLFDIPQYHKVIAWQPLPEPYKKEGGRE